MNAQAPQPTIRERTTHRSIRARLMEKHDFEELERRVDQLVDKCSRLQEENMALRQQQSHLVAERATLIEKSELARTRVESMISRLKSMEV